MFYFTEKIDINDEAQLWHQVELTAKEHRLRQTLAALPVIKEQHKNQIRNGLDQDYPYTIHPLVMACQVIAMGIIDDDILATTLLHDVIEDGDITLEDLDVSEAVGNALLLLTFERPEGLTKDEAKSIYYDRMKDDRLATFVKVVDRCNNVSTMAFGFDKAKMEYYIYETETYVLPMLNRIRLRYPEFANAAFLLDYQITTAIETAAKLIRE